jgi:hypothetical protein
MPTRYARGFTSAMERRRIRGIDYTLRAPLIALLNELSRTNLALA